MACHRLLVLVVVAGIALAPAAGLATTIYDVQYNETTQGSGDDCFPSPMYTQEVTVEGIVTAVTPGTFPNFWLEESTGGPWTGVFFYDTSINPSRGDNISVTALVDEYYGLTELKNVSDFEIISTGNALPDAIDIETGDLTGGCNAGSEAYEGLLVRVTNVTVTIAPNQYGEWYVDDGTGECQIDDLLFEHSPALGDTFASIVGVVQYNYGEYEINPRDAEDLGAEPPQPAETIYDVQYNETEQGTGDDCFPSPYKDQEVTVQGVVTAVLTGDYHDFWLQTPDKGLWSGVFVYDVSVDPNPGDLLTMTATPDEYFGLTEMQNVTSFEIHSSGNDLPPATDIETGDLTGGCNAGSEAYEGMLVRVRDVTVTQAPNSYGEWYVDDGTGECQIDDNMYSYASSLGDTFAAIIGVVHYAYGEYEINPRNASDIQTEITAVEDAGDRATLPQEYRLSQNFPNPFNPETEIRYALPERAHVHLEVYNLLGQKVITLADGLQGAGEHVVRWDGTGDHGFPLASGLYFYRLKAGEYSATKKMIYLK